MSSNSPVPMARFHPTVTASPSASERVAVSVTVPPSVTVVGETESDTLGSTSWLQVLVGSSSSSMVTVTDVGEPAVRVWSEPELGVGKFAVSSVTVRVSSSVSASCTGRSSS